MAMAGIVGVVEHRTPQSQPVGWRQRSRAHPTPLVPGSAWACLASLHSCHSTAPGRLTGGGRRCLRGAWRGLIQKKGMQNHSWHSSISEREPRADFQARPGSGQEGNLCSGRCSARVGVENPEISTYHN